MSPSPVRSPWIVVLAAGDGRRLESLARDGDGCTVPKQYCSLRGGRSLLHATLDRARRLAPRERIVTVVARDHRRWWERELAQSPPENLVIQPRNRGTAAGVLLPLRTILARDPDAVIGVLPSDHFVADEEVFGAALAQALGAAGEESGRLVLLGVEAERPDADLGWIVPGAAAPHPWTVDAFVEKPPREEAAHLMRRGALWNSFAFAVRARALDALLRSSLPELVRRFDQVRPESSPAELAELYETLPDVDFSRSVLAGLAAELRVVAVPRCGWMDLGTPERIARCLADFSAFGTVTGGGEAAVNLAAALERHRAPAAAPAAPTRLTRPRPPARRSHWHRPAPAHAGLR
jgi:mannose-1-phosphate guanylyltransferase